MSITQNLADIRARIAEAARLAGRDPADTALMAVSKFQPEDKINEALAAGQRLFGENRVQDAQKRWGHRKADMPDLMLHLIGALQTNKVREAVALFDVIQTLDREKLARALAEEMTRQGRPLPCFIQVNTGEEPQKGGVLPHDLPPFHDFCVKACGLDIRGLMGLPPENDPPALHFALLKHLAGQVGVSGLSMGMSGDYDKAVALGSTIVRIGTGLFGTRENPLAGQAGAGG